MLRLSLCNYNNAYILAEGNITVINIGTAVAPNNCAPFTDCISEINNTQINNAKDVVAVMPIHNIIEYSNICSEHWEVYGNTIKIN